MVSLRRRLSACASPRVLSLLAGVPLGLGATTIALPPAAAADETLTVPLTETFVPEDHGVTANETVFVMAPIVVTGADGIASGLSYVTVENAAEIMAELAPLNGIGEAVRLQAGGAVVNGAESVISGGSGVAIAGSGNVDNLGRIEGTQQAGISFGGEGSVATPTSRCSRRCSWSRGRTGG